MMNAPVVVSDPGFLPTTRQMACALADRLAAYFIPYVASGGGWSGPPWLRRRLARRALPPGLKRRARTVRSGPELLRQALARTGIRALDYRLIWQRNVAFDRSVAPLVPDGATVIGQYGGCLATFERVRRGGGRTVLDYPIARVELGQQILREEARLRPDFADSIAGRGALAQASHLARIAEEVARSDVIVVGSRFAAQSFNGCVAPGRVRVVPYGVDTSRFRPRESEPVSGPLRVLFAGQITQRKGVAYLLDAMRRLDPGRFHLTLVGPLTGSGRGLRRYEGWHRHLSSVRPEEMPDIYRAADVLVLPSLVEGSALVVLEAMASGLPVIVTPNAGADAVRDGVDGYVAPIRSGEEIAAALETLGADPELRARMGRAARRRALTFDWTQFHRQFREAIGLTPEGTPAASEVALR